MAKFDGVDGESRGGYMALDEIGRSSGYMKIEWTAFAGPDKLVQSVRQPHPQGVDGILIGLRRLPGYHVTVGSNGIIAILIGLLLPAVQKLAAANSPDLRILSDAIAPKGQIAFAMGDGSVRLTQRAQAQPTSSKWIDVLSQDWGIVSPRDSSSGMATGRRQ